MQRLVREGKQAHLCNARDHKPLLVDGAVIGRRNFARPSSIKIEKEVCRGHSTKEMSGDF